MDPLVLTSNTGYVVLETAAPLPREAGLVLLPLARAAIASELGIAGSARDDLPWLKQQGACFVTIMGAGQLRGCIGTLRPHRALGEDVRGNAVAAAFRDPRFKPLVAAELDAMSLEISVLSALQALVFSDERDALRQLRPGLDGVVLEYGQHSSTFLPQVWESFADPADFVGQLKRKAGLPPDLWDGNMKLMRYTVEKWREQEENA
jgi:AmmeMemoRadiSam system protein A